MSSSTVPGQPDPRLGPDSTQMFPDGEMGSLMRAFDWSRTSLGPMANWPQSLKTSVSICLASRFPIVLYWGREYVVLYNDAYSVILGSKHPWALGQTCRACWAEIWDTIGPMLDGVLQTAKATWSDDLLLMLQRFGYPEECYFSFSFSPVQVESGAVGGVFTAVIETTEKVIGERRLRTLRDLAAHAVAAKSEQDVWQIAAGTLGENPRDLPFAVLCDASGEGFRVAGTAAIAAAHPLCAALCQPGSELFQKAVQVVKSGQPAELEELGSWAPDLPCRAWAAAPGTALLLPIVALGQGPTGLLLAAVSPAKKLDEGYRTFFDLLARQIATSVADARAYEQERKRAEALAELDRAKTRFFSNVSHEFRTPLTLMLGPLEEVLSQARERLDAVELEQLAVARRNALRLLKLVNTLLDLSRIEAGPVQAVYKPTDLAALTAELAGIFRSAMEKAGLRFVVRCQPLGEPVYVDRDLWEQVVLNLLSNAFKFTFAGEVEVALRSGDGHVALTVRDTGVGIPEKELPCIFQRFHRVESSRARTYEGTGIGLALVQELVKLHGGSVRVESVDGRGSAFTVTIPRGKAHLPPDRIQATQTPIANAPSVEAYLDEAKRWLPQESGTPPVGQTQLPALRTSASPVSSNQGDLIVVADDNADMRDYLARLLGKDYRVHIAANGFEAVAAVRQLRPALVLTDVMMPGLDGRGVLRAIREDPAINSTPVILLSARAGEESQLEGLESGADDYLVKPFTARELLARVATHVKMANVRRESAEREARLRTQAEQNEERLRLAQQAAAIGSFEWDLQTGVNRWTPELEAMYGLPPGGFTGSQEAWEKLVHPEDKAKVLEQVAMGFKTNAPVQGEWRVVWPDGSIHWIFGRWQVLSDPSAKPVRMTGINVDVTTRKAAEELRSKLAAIVESSDDAIASKDLNGIVTSWNRSAEKLFGYKAGEIIGRPITLIIPPELQQDEEMILGKIRRGEKIDHFETVRRTKSGERVEVSLTISPVRDEHGRVIGAAKIARDITEKKKVERALRTAEKLAAAGRLATTVAHEINNPLAAVTNLIYLAQHDLPAVERVAAHLQLASRELERVAHITRQTLGFYRDTSSPTRVSVSAILNDLLFLYEKRLEGRNIRVIKQYHNDVEITALAGEIRQAFSNFITNAVDAMPLGGSLLIRVSQSRRWSKPRLPGVRVTILDTGSGIEPLHRKSIFEPFFTTKADVGTGLGLWITRNIVKKHRGFIQVKTKTGPEEHGTAFSIFLPLNGIASSGEGKKLPTGPAPFAA